MSFLEALKKVTGNSISDKRRNSDTSVVSNESDKIENVFVETDLKLDNDSVTSDANEAEDSKNNPFVNPKVETYYCDLYESTQYECRERFDSNFKWTKEEQRRLTWKLDIRVTLLACFLFVGLQIDRTNLTQAVSDNMLINLGMTTNDYNNGNTIFYVCFLAAELPSQLISKRLGSDIWIPIQMSLWSIVTITQCKITDKHGFYVTRALIGLMEGGFIPDLVLWLSYFYTGTELAIRLSCFWTALYATNICNYLIAFGILHMGGVRGWYGWQWLFLIEGVITLCIGISAFFLMVPSVVQTKKLWNPKGWFTLREEQIIVNKILRDDPTKGDMHNRQGLTLKMLYLAISDWHLWPIYLIGITAYLPENTLGAYITLLLKDMGYTTFHVNLLCIPYNFLKIIILLSVTWLSERVTNIFGVAMLQPLWMVPLIGVLRFWKGTMVNTWGTYVLLTLALAVPYIHAMMVSACSRNSQSIKTRTVSASLYNMFVQAGSIISSNIYRTPDKPLYHKGNAALFGIALSMFLILGLTKWFYVAINKNREKKWNALSPEDQEHYILNTEDKGSSRLDFRFAH